MLNIILLDHVSPVYIYYPLKEPRAGIPLTYMSRSSTIQVASDKVYHIYILLSVSLVIYYDNILGYDKAHHVES